MLRGSVRIYGYKSSQVSLMVFVQSQVWLCLRGTQLGNQSLVLLCLNFKVGSSTPSLLFSLVFKPVPFPVSSLMSGSSLTFLSVNQSFIGAWWNSISCWMGSVSREGCMCVCACACMCVNLCYKNLFDLHLHLLWVSMIYSNGSRYHLSKALPWNGVRLWMGRAAESISWEMFQCHPH